MNYYLHPFVAQIESTAQTLARLLGLQVAPQLSPVIGPRSDKPLLGPLPMDGRSIHSNEKLEGLHLHGGTWTGLEHRIDQGPCEGALLRGLWLREASKWASRSYRMGPRNRVIACAFQSVYPEHALYWNLRGGEPESSALSVQRCLFLDIASQAIQTVYRAQEQGFDFAAAGDGEPGGSISVVDCLVRNAGFAVGDGNARSAFALSFFTSPHKSVRVVRTIVDKTMQVRSSGALLVQRFPSAFVGSSAFLVAEAIQPVLQFEGTEHVEIRSCAVFAEGGQAWISIQGAKSISIHGCRGNVRVHADGHDVGSIEDSIQLGQPGS